MLYKEWLSEWFENFVKTAVKERTYAKYADIVKVRLISAFGDYELNDLTPLHHSTVHNRTVTSRQLEKRRRIVCQHGKFDYCCHTEFNGNGTINRANIRI